MAKTETATAPVEETVEERTEPIEQMEHEAHEHGGPGAPKVNSRVLATDKDAKSTDDLLVQTGRKFVSLERDAYSKEKRSADVEAKLVGLLAERIPVLSKLSLKMVAGWIQEARKGFHNHQSVTTFLQDPTNATAPERVKPTGRDSYRQLAYRRMMLARITAAVGGRLSPTGKSLFRKSENADLVRDGLKLSDGLVYTNPVEMLAAGWSLRKTLAVWSEALHPKVKNLRDVPVSVTAEHISGLIPGLKATVKETTVDKETGETIEKTKRVVIMSQPDLCADAIVALLDRAIAYKFGPKISSDRYDQINERLTILMSQTPDPAPEGAQG